MSSLSLSLTLEVSLGTYPLVYRACGLLPQWRWAWGLSSVSGWLSHVTEPSLDI